MCTGPGAVAPRSDRTKIEHSERSVLGFVCEIYADEAPHKSASCVLQGF